MMNSIKRLYYKLTGNAKRLSDEMINDIRLGGGVVGNNVEILNSQIDMRTPYLIHIGNNVTITGVNILTHDASLKKTVGFSKAGKVYIGDDVFIGNGAIILPNTVIGSKVVIGAGTVIAKDIPDNSVVVGNPCRIISTYDEYVSKTKILMKENPVIDKYPSEFNDSDKQTLTRTGFGYIK